MKINSIFKFIMLVLILGFMFMVIASKSGYYEYQLSNKRDMTDEAILRFEEDVKEGKYIDINNYIDNKSVDYNNKISNVGNSISKTINSVLAKGFTYVFNYLNRQIEK